MAMDWSNITSHFLGFLPTLSDPTLNFVRSVYGLLLLLTLLHALPSARRFFVTEFWRGYTDSSRRESVLQYPVSMVLIQAAWLTSAFGLLTGYWSVFAALTNALICRYFFITMRWAGVQRGMGAPGFICHWLGNAVFWLELCRHAFPTTLPLVLLALHIDFAFIIFSAGFYKLRSGYVVNEGMEYGLVNPEWGYWWSKLKDLSPKHLAFRISNHLGWSMEILAAILMVIPSTRFYGGCLLILSFAYVGILVRLSWLVEMVMLIGVLYFVQGNQGDFLVSALASWLPGSVNIELTPPEWTRHLVEAGFGTYIAVMPLAYGGMFLNLYGKRRLSEPFQRVLESYTNVFGMILWRVFSVDLINFFVQVSIEDASGTRRKVSRWGRIFDMRYNHVCEAISVTCLFTLLKYFPDDRTLFHFRIRRYAETLSAREGESVVFEVVIIQKEVDRFRFVPVLEVSIRANGGEIQERELYPDYDFSKRHTSSRMRPGARLGSYAPPGE